MKYTWLSAAALTVLAGCSQSPEKHTHASSAAKIDAYNAQFCGVDGAEQLDLTDVRLTRADNITLNYQGFNNIEGPVWYDGALYYSNIGAHQPDENGFVLTNQTTLWRWQPGQAPEVWLDDTKAGTNGLGLSKDNQLVAVRHSEGDVVKINWQSQEVTPLATVWEDKRFNSPNDLTVGYDGSVYFSDPNWDTPSNVDKATTQGGGAPGSIAPGQRAYRIGSDGVVRPLAVTELVPDLRDKINGVMLSYDQRHLFVGGLRGLWRFDLHAGLVSNPKKVFDTAIDGMGKDCSGNIYVTTTRELAHRKDGQVVVILAPDLSEVGQLEAEGIHIVTNIAFGGEDRKTLFVTALTAPTLDDGSPRMCGEKACAPAGIFTTKLNVAGFPH